MKNKLVVAIVGLSAVAAWVGACNIAQPNQGCPIPHTAGTTPIAVKYVNTGGPATCKDLKGEELGTEKYVIPGKLNEKATVKILPAGIGDLLNGAGRTDSNAADQAIATGQIDVLPDSNHFCTVSGISKQEQDFDAIPDTLLPDGGIDTPGSPELYVAYEWTDMKFLERQDLGVTGQQMLATVKITNGPSKTSASNTTCTYEAWGLYPDVDCTVADVNPTDTNAGADGGTAPCTPDTAADDCPNSGICGPDGLCAALCTADTDCAKGGSCGPDGQCYVGDSSACLPKRDLDAGRPLGSGINPAFPDSECYNIAAGAFRCMIPSQPPSLRAAGK